VEELPDYTSMLDERSGVNGHLLPFDCGVVCPSKKCDNMPWYRFFGESENVRPLLSRLWPIMMDEEENLLVDTSCPAYRMMSPRFKNEATRVWKHLMSYPKVRNHYKESLQDGTINIIGCVPIENIKPEFDDDYYDFLQKYVKTGLSLEERFFKEVPDGGVILDVGAGNGDRVRELIQRGYKAIGLEVNPRLVDNDFVFHGDIHSIPYEDNFADLVICVDVLEHVQDPMAALEELLRVSKGVVVIQVTTLEDPSFAEDPTHVVEWNQERWKREISEYAFIEYCDEQSTMILRRK